MQLRLPQAIVYLFIDVLFIVAERLLSAGHDISDGGLITCLLEMAFAGNRGVDVDFVSEGVGGGRAQECIKCNVLTLTRLS